MSVATKNPFALLGEESPPDSTASKPAATTQAAAPAAKDAQRKSGPASRGGRYYSRGGGAKPAEGGGEGDALYDGPKKYDGDVRGRGRGRGRGDSRGGRGGRGGRPYDRHSATGKTDSEKKVHQGWGGDDGDEELKNETAADNDAAKEASWGGDNNKEWVGDNNNDWGGDNNNDWGGVAADADAWGAPPAVEGQTADGPAADAAAAAPDGEKGAGGEGRRREREPEEEDNTLTLDEYLAQRKAKEALPKLEGTRKANEGGEFVVKGATQLKKGDEEEQSYFAGKGKSAPKARTEKKEKVYIELDVQFERPSRGGRGGRGGDRGGDRGRERGSAPRASAPRGRGGPYRGRGNTAVDVGDQKAFPSLS